MAHPQQSLPQPAPPVAAGAWNRATSFAGAWGRAAAGVAYALTAGLLSRRRRASIVRIAREFGYDHVPGEPPLLPRIDAESLAPADTRVALVEPVGRDGNVTLYELLLLSRFIPARECRTVFEIGTFDGRTTLNLATNARPGTIVYTLDLPLASTPALHTAPGDDALTQSVAANRMQRRYAGRPEAGAIVELHGDSATFDFTPYAKTIDLVFVDGAHSPEYVMRDSESALAIAAPGALIAWHDYGQWPGVTAALNALYRSDPRFSGLRHLEHTSLAVLEVPRG